MLPSDPAERAKIAAAMERVPCRTCGKPRWWHSLRRKFRHDDGHLFQAPKQIHKRKRKP